MITVMYSNYTPSPAHLARLEAMVGPGRVNVADSESTALTLAGETEIVLGHRYLRQILPEAHRLRWVQATSAGFDHLPWEILRERGILFSRNTRNSRAVAHHVLALIWSLLRRLPETMDAQRRHVWAAPPVMLPLPRTALVLGLGATGLCIVKLLRGLGLYVRGTSLSGTEAQRLGCDQFLSADIWRAYLPETDILVLAMPYTDSTRGCIGERELAALPDHAVLVNIARAGLLDLGALIAALQAGRLGGAALDVMDPRPEASAPVWDTPGLLLTPGVAAYHTDMQADFEAFAEAQVERYLTGKSLHCVV